MPYPLSPKVAPKKVKNRRKMFFKPTYEVYGFDSQVKFDASRWTKAQVDYFAQSPTHANYQRALAVLELNAV